ncbi:hypothetical protein EB241_15555 [Erwinia psidii]|uniref:Uncharacterized protein n=1 Tax=Erwinia psidii TaxID=69224 RepID=A0A3N6UX09_9GAMM|nr:hypothetical protein EB241_15555 [Erwinia psidii]
MFKPENAENGLMVRDPKGRGQITLLLRDSPFVWITKQMANALLQRYLTTGGLHAQWWDTAYGRRASLPNKSLFQATIKR